MTGLLRPTGHAAGGARARRLIAAVATLGSIALVGGTMSAPATGAAPTQAKPVSLAPLPAESEVGKRITVKGTVQGGRAQVKVQRKYAGAGWRTVARTTSKASGAYAVKVRLVRGGTTSFRAVKAGARSGVRSLKVYQWLDLASQPQWLSDQVLINQPARLGGRLFRSSYLADDDAFVVANVAHLCTRGEAWAGFRDGDLDQLVDGDVTGVLGGGRTADNEPVGPPPAPTLVQAGQAPRREAFPLTGAATVVFSFEVAAAAPAVSAVLGSPRIYCNATRLPAFNENLLVRAAPGPHRVIR